MLSLFLLYTQKSLVDLLLANLDIPHGTQIPRSVQFSAIVRWDDGHYNESPPNMQDHHESHDPELPHHESHHNRTGHNHASGPVILNPARAAGFASDKHSMIKLLRVNGLQAAEIHHINKGTLSAPRLYKIPVFHLDALAIFHNQSRSYLLSERMSGHRPYMELEWNPHLPLQRRLIHTAIRAVYSLGLDMGMAHLGVDPAGRITVYAIEPVPALDFRLAELFASAIRRYGAQLAAESIRTTPVVMGMDPEFLLRTSSGKIISASRYLHKHGQAGCDALLYRNNRVIYPLAELRPQPSTELRQLLVNLHRTMRFAARKINDPALEWIAGGMPNKGFPLGGHLHLSGIWLNHELLRALDNYLALPLVMIEDDTTRMRRPRYGFLGDFRRQPHGGFEYRTLPSWMISPRIAKGVLALTRLIADHYRKLKLRPLLEAETVQYFYDGNKKRLAQAVSALWDDLERQTDYGAYQRYLDPLKYMVLGQIPWNEQRDLRKLWKIPPFHH